MGCKNRRLTRTLASADVCAEEPSAHAPSRGALAIRCCENHLAADFQSIVSPCIFCVSFHPTVQYVGCTSSLAHVVCRCQMHCVARHTAKVWCPCPWVHTHGYTRMAGPRSNSDSWSPLGAATSQCRSTPQHCRSTPQQAEAPIHHHNDHHTARQTHRPPWPPCTTLLAADHTRPSLRPITLCTTLRLHNSPACM